MSKLTTEQKRLVEENHKLIYWYASLKGLELEDWYGLLAIELCDAVSTFDETKGSLSNYYKLKADRLLINEFAKQTRQKRTHNGIYELNDVNQPVDVNVAGDDYEIKEFVKKDDTGVLELKMHGYTQSEIADRLSISQASVSRILNRLKEEFNGGRWDD